MAKSKNQFLNATQASFCAITVGALLAICGTTQAQLRVVTYNTRTNPSLSDVAVVLEAIGEENVGGIAKPIDVLLLQEQSSPTGTTQDILDELNTIYGSGTYALSPLVGTATSASFPLRQGAIYNTNTVELISSLGLGSPSAIGIPRQPLLYQFRPVGYDSSADFYAYNSHYKASSSAADQADRLLEANFIRSHSDIRLGEGTSVIYAGDYNMRSSSEDAFQSLISSGAGQAFDPINQLGSWNNNSAFAQWHTQSPCETACTGGFAGGGVDDRFDFQLVTGELLDNEGMSYLSGSYHTFGNNGSTFNDAINVGNSISLNGVTSFSTQTVLNALENATDHLPVVVDYQVPAILDALVATIPTTLLVGETFDLDLTIFNDADVIVAGGADELDYSLSVMGDLIPVGSLFGTDNALGGGNLHEILFDTTSLGLKSGLIEISTSSQSAANNFISIPISFEVIAAGLAGDFNDDGSVDAADYTVWRDNLGGSVVALNGNGNGDGNIDSLDYDLWVLNFGTTNSSSTTTVPEPTGLLLTGLTLGLVGVVLPYQRCTPRC